MRRREFLTRGAALGVASSLMGCDSVEQRLTRPALPSDALMGPQETRQSPTARLLNRVAYGPRPGDVARVERMGLAAYVEEQLSPETITEDATLLWRLRPLGDTLNANVGDLFDVDDHQLVSTLRQETLLRAVYSECQLLERMTDFWRDHFNIYAFKGHGPQYLVGDQRDVIRPHALGRFSDLLQASARSAAMLGYLDNDVNVKGAPNENYARELMELHTLGVHGGYSQRDVQEVARCLTGWTVDEGWFRGRFRFDPDRHDDGQKSVLGVTIPAGGGITDGQRVMALLASYPATARHISEKLCIRFLGHAPSPWVERLATLFHQNGGDIQAMLRPLLTSPDLRDGPPILKRPLDLAVSALRAYNADTDGGGDLQRHLEAMGQPLFAWPMPNGFPDRASAWTGALIPRWNFALALTEGRIGGTSVDWASLTEASAAIHLPVSDGLLSLAFAGRRDTSLASVRVCAATASPREAAALALMSPAFQWR